MCLRSLLVHLLAVVAAAVAVKEGLLFFSFSFSVSFAVASGLVLSRTLGTSDERDLIRCPQLIRHMLLQATQP